MRSEETARGEKGRVDLKEACQAEFNVGFLLQQAILLQLCSNTKYKKPPSRDEYSSSHSPAPNTAKLMIPATPAKCTSIHHIYVGIAKMPAIPPPPESPPFLGLLYAVITRVDLEPPPLDLFAAGLRLATPLLVPEVDLDF